MLKMNSRFEPDGEKRQINNLFGLGNLLNIKIEQKEDVPKDEKELKKFINNKCNQKETGHWGGRYRRVYDWV